MKRLITVFVIMAVAGYGYAQSLVAPPSGNNQKAKVIQNIGPVEISVAYSSPHVHTATGTDRTGHIWGELVHYGFADQGFGVKSAPWRAGANENTVIKFSHDVKIEGKDLKAGSYGLFLATAKEGPWTWIFSTNTGSWGSFFYNQSEDALRVDVTPKEAPFTEYLMYGFDDRQPNSATVYLQWENKRIPFKVEADVNNIYVSMMRDQLRSNIGFDYRNFSQAANFCAANKINLDEALIWADKAIKEPFRGAVLGHEDFSTLRTKAAVLGAMGRTQEADKLMESAITLPGTEPVDVYRYGMQLLNEKRNTAAMKIFEANRKQHPTEQFWTSLGLARGYTAAGDKKNAIANWEILLANVPENLVGNKPRWQDALKKLKESN